MLRVRARVEVSKLQVLITQRHLELFLQAMRLRQLVMKRQEASTLLLLGLHQWATGRIPCPPPDQPATSLEQGGVSLQCLCDPQGMSAYK
jgi:hypothetical protein